MAFMKCFSETIPQLIGTQVDASVSYLINKELRPSVEGCVFGYELWYPLDSSQKPATLGLIAVVVCDCN
jgi:hypothetical protein